MSDPRQPDPSPEAVAARRRELAGRVRDLDGVIAAHRDYLREAPGAPLPGRPDRLAGAAGPAHRAEDALATLRRLRDAQRRRDGLFGELRDIDLGRHGSEGSRADPESDAPPGRTVGVLLPLRLETRFDPGTLRLRVIPDEPWFGVHDPSVSDGELVTLERYVDAVAAAGTPEAARMAFDDLAGMVGGPRAVWLIRTFVGVDDDGAATVERPPDDELRTEPTFAGIEGFPSELHVWLARGGGPPAHVLTLEVDPSLLGTDPPDPELDEHRWWDDWDTAVAAGLADTIPLDGDPHDIDALYVTGLGDAAPAALFEAHRDAGVLGLVAPGTPTNTVDGAPAANLATTPGEWWKVLQTPAGNTQRAISLALTGDPDLLGGLPGDDEPQRVWNAAAVAGLWPALWGFAADDVWATGAGAEAAAWAPHAVFPEGPYPTLRIGSQPYGLLPATALSRWRQAAEDPPAEAGLPERLVRLGEHWREAAERRGTTSGATTEQLLDLLASVPTAPGYRQRPAWALELWWLGSLMLGFDVPWDTFDAAWHERHGLSAQLGLHPARRYGATWAPRRITLPIVRPPQMPVDETVHDAIVQLTEIAWDSPQKFADPASLEEEFFVFPLDGLLLRLVIRSLQVALGDIGREALGEAPPPALDPLARPPGQPTHLERWLAALDPRLLQGDTPAVAAFHRVVEALLELATAPEERLDWLVRTTIDTATHRLDPWIVAPAVRRLEDLSSDDATQWRLGAYGWVDAPAPGTPGPTAGGLLHAPSQGQALTAAVLRDRAVADAEADRWRMRVTSRTIRAADRISQQVRLGAHPAEALGREVERVVGDRASIDGLRRDFPLREEHAGRRTCDGLAVLAADPEDLGLSDAAQEGLTELRAAVDTYGDLLVAESLHHLIQGRADAASAAMDAAAGLGRPPELDVVRTRRQGRAVATGVLAVLPAVAAPPAPATLLEQAQVSPATLVDAAAAAFVAAQLGTGQDWVWAVADAGGGPETVMLAELGLGPADALALPVEDLERLVLEAGAERLGLAAGVEVALVDDAGSVRYEQAARLVGLLGRNPATADAVDAAPEPSGDEAIDAEVTADLASRFQQARAAAEALRDLLATELAATAPDGGLGGADEQRLRELSVAARRWGIAPDPPDDLDPGGPHRLVATSARVHDLLVTRLAQAPEDAGGLSRDDLVEALTGLVSPTGQVAVLSRLPAGALPELVEAGASGSARLDEVWLSVVSAVREHLALLEVHQLGAGTAAGSGPPLVAWSNKPTDPWQQDDGDARRFVAVYAASGLDIAGLPPDAAVAVAHLDRFTEFVPSEDQTTGAAFGFDAPAARAPQAILLAIPPEDDRPLDAEALFDIVAETRALARIRMARPVDLAADVRGLVPSVLLPATGPSAVSLEPR